MDLTNILSSRLDKDFLVQLFNEQNEVHQSAIQISLKNHQPQSWRATWILSNCTKANDNRIKPYVNDYIKAIVDKKDGHQREILKILLKMKLNDEQEGRLFDICMNLWENIGKASGLRYLSFKFIVKTCEKYPELNGELVYVCQEQYLENLTPGIKKIIARIVKTGK
ncbi:hypothetical protein ACXGQW_10810 [Wenyingzhuangia sp. IMCC45533]